jgi:hypothetical protein
MTLDSWKYSPKQFQPFLSIGIAIGLPPSGIVAQELPRKSCFPQNA